MRTEANWKSEMRQRPCIYCGKTPAGTIEHIVPRSRGGLDCKENCAAACNDCNSRRGSMPIAKFAPQLNVIDKGRKKPVIEVRIKVLKWEEREPLTR